MQSLQSLLLPSIQKATGNTLGDAFSRSVRRNGDREALAFESRRWSFVELDKAANRVAQALQSQGLAHGDRVAVYGKNSDAYLILWMACNRLGLIHVPVNFALVQEELEYILVQSGARAVFFDPGLQANVDGLRERIPATVFGCLRDGAEEGVLDLLTIALSDAHAERPDVLVQESDIAQILYTSGTTSDPKGAMHTHRSIVTEYMSCILHLDIKESDRSLAALPLYHSAQMHVFTMPSLLIGAHTYLVENPVPEALLACIEAEKITSFFAPPTLWIGLLHHALFDQRDLSCLQKLYYGASIMPEPIVHELEKRLPGSQLYNCYGQTEIAPLATVLLPEEHATRARSAGRPLLSVETRILSLETGEDCAPGEHGEIVHRSPHLMVGYWDKPDETAEAFSDGWFHSGDLAYQDEEGYIYIVDRIKDVVNTGGVLVASRDVEEAIYRHPEVAEVAVIGLPDERWIEAITAIVVLKQDSDLDEATLIEHIKPQLAAFKVPKTIYFSEGLPKNTAGKLLKRRLREQYTD